MPIVNISIHHSGGRANDKYASSATLTPEDIENSHKLRWNFKSELGKYAGYNFIYSPIDRKFTQHRKIGEETAAQKGYNFNTISICIIGNYTLQPDGTPVDTLLPHTSMDVVEFLINLIKGNHNWAIKEGTQIALTPFRIHPHRFYQQTECYGDAIGDEYFKAQVILRYYPKLPSDYIIGWVYKIIDTLKKMRPTLGSADRSCEGVIN